MALPSELGPFEIRIVRVSGVNRFELGSSWTRLAPIDMARRDEARALRCESCGKVARQSRRTGYRCPAASEAWAGAKREKIGIIESSLPEARGSNVSQARPISPSALKKQPTGQNTVACVCVAESMPGFEQMAGVSKSVSARVPTLPSRDDSGLTIHVRKKIRSLYSLVAERQTCILKVPGSIPGGGWLGNCVRKQSMDPIA